MTISLDRLLWLLPILPLAGFLLLVLTAAWLPRKAVAVVGVGSVALAALVALALGSTFLTSPGHVATQTLWVWMHVEQFAPGITFRLDALSLVMAVVITVVGFLIHLYSASFMRDEEGYARFFAYMNLFVASMLVLVLADNLLLLYLGWEGVGLCSYLLIGFRYADPANGKAAMKAFIVTRIGDTALAVALFLLFTSLGTLQIQSVMTRAAATWSSGSAIAIAAALLILLGAVGKSAQLPLQTWLPDAMAGPTPVSALLHAATMVTAGVYLIARLHVLFTLAPGVMLGVAVIGTVTLLIAAFSALAQRDIKRVLAYSTMSQIGYMFLALGVGAWAAAIFHFFTHAFFKSLLFLSAGVVIKSLHEEHDIKKMGGLRTSQPLAFWTFLIGAASLAALPLLTAGFYSKDLILSQVWTSLHGSVWLWAGGWIGAILTGWYIFRVVFLTFFGREQRKPIQVGGLNYTIPLVTLATLSVIAGWLELPRILGNRPFFTDFLHSVLPAAPMGRTGGGEGLLLLASAAASLLGIGLAYLLYLRARPVTERIEQAPIAKVALIFWQMGWGFDWLYTRLFIRPYRRLALLDRDDVVDRLYTGIAWGSMQLHRFLSDTQNGKVRRYAVGLTAGAVIIIALLVFL